MNISNHNLRNTVRSKKVFQTVDTDESDSLDSDGKPKRRSKINMNQKKILLQFMADNPLIFKRIFTVQYPSDYHKNFWGRMTTAMNLFGPPKKTVVIWKKVWKDLKLRYRKRGVDLGQLLIKLKRNRVVNTSLLLDTIDTIRAKKKKLELTMSFKNSVFIEQVEKTVPDILVDCEAPGCLFEDDDRGFENYVKDNDRGFEKHYVKDDVPEYQLKEESCDLGKLELVTDIENAEINCNEDLCEVAYEDISETYFENEADPLTEDREELSDNLDMKCLVLHDLVVEDIKLIPEKIHPSNLETQSLPEKSSCSCSNIAGLSPKDDSKHDVLENILHELQQHNKLQKEKLQTKKMYLNFKRKILVQTLNAQKEISRSQILLAKSINNFIDNISFNT